MYGSGRSLKVKGYNMSNSGADDILALLNVTSVVVPSETLDNQNVASNDDQWQNVNIKDEVVQTIPIVILDDGQIALQCNGQYFLMSGIQGEEVVEPGLSNAAVNLNSCEQISPSVPVVTVDNASVDTAEEPVGNTSLSDEIDVVSVDCNEMKPIGSTNGTSSNSCNHTTNDEWVPVEYLKDVFPAVTSFKCLSCQFTTQNQEEIGSHIHTDFVIISQTQMGSVKTSISPDGLIKEDKDVQERFLYLCSQCSDIFATLDQCRDHMIKDHNMILSDDSNEEAVQSSLPLKPIDTNSANNEKSNSCNESVSNNENTETNSKSLSENVEQKVKNTGKNRIRSLKVDPDYDVRPFKCKHVSCVQRFRSSEALAQHTACHKGPNRREYACSQCGSKFDEWRHCSLHLWNAHNIDVDLYTCGVCGMHKTTSRLNLETHMKIHRDIREYPCPECGKRFKQKAQLRNHRITHIKKKEMIVPTAQPPRWYMTQKCHICYKTYADSKCLKKHIQAVHSKLKPYVCHVCGHSSARKAMLQAHLRQHTGEKPYACQSCSFRTGDHNSLRRHMMRHSGERPYKCPHCPYASIQSTSFKNHLQIRHPGKGGAFACLRCTFTTVSHSSFVQHLSDHKNNLIQSDQTDDVEVFPENVAAAQLVYQCLGACPGDGSRFQADVTASSTSDDGLGKFNQG
ncbi:uncharacterized protein LOC142327119 isoform X2 [Lycorma delicatula]|uniref:uncharacterized protein LOC142327119 isoform X2 n=1 Tax=Lycorma delicatula TaxID=130591 RepID=UPI003F512457